MKRILVPLICICVSVASCDRSPACSGLPGEVMMFADSTKTGSPMSKDPHVIYFKGRYLMYYSAPPAPEGTRPDVPPGWSIRAAESKDLVHWDVIGEISRDTTAAYELSGYCAPCARVIDDKVHLFYQTYGTGKKDAICHSVSEDGINFKRDASNPIFSPEPSWWTCGRAIDAEVYEFKGKYFLYFASRDTSYRIQLPGVAVADSDTDFNRGDWKLAVNAPILKPELDWEQECIEGMSVIEKYGKLFMFYAGAYNNGPQQIGVAVSKDGINWKRLSDKPFLSNGPEGSWNSSESGHPHIFEAPDGRTYLFFQGNNTNGKTWYLSKYEVIWKHHRPYLCNYEQ